MANDSNDSAGATPPLTLLEAQRTIRRLTRALSLIADFDERLAEELPSDALTFANRMQRIAARALLGPDAPPAEPVALPLTVEIRRPVAEFRGWVQAMKAAGGDVALPPHAGRWRVVKVTGDGEECIVRGERVEGGT